MPADEGENSDGGPPTAEHPSEVDEEVDDYEEVDCDENIVDGDEDVIVRPFGYVHDEAVVARVDDREAYIGNVYAADPTAHDRSFAHVLTLTDDRQPLTTHHRPFSDSLDHDAAAFRDAVDVARTLLARDGATLVHCRAGVSRSSAVLATAIAAVDGRRFRDALDAVQAARPFAMPNPALVESAVVYLAADADPEGST